MPISVNCSVCGAGYNLKDEFAGRSVKCPACQSVIAVPTPSAVSNLDADNDDIPVARPTGARTASATPDVPEEFQRDKFLLRQKMWTLKEKYNVADEHNDPIIFVERPIFLGKSCLAMLAGILVMFVLAGGGVAGGMALQGTIGKEPAAIVAGVLGLIGFLIGLAVIIQLYPKRHITFYSDESKTDMLMRAFQDQKWVFINQLYTLADNQGNLLCRFRKNHLHGIFRKRWYVETLDGELLFVVKEDSILLSLLRRTIGILTDEIPLLGLALAAVLRTNFIFCRADDGKVLGEFNRRMTLLDRYVLDLSRDRDGEIDRRIAVAMGVLLDTGEKR